MKFLLIASLSLFSIVSMANKEHMQKHEERMKKWDNMSFEDAKKMDKKMITEKRSMIDEMQACVDKAANKMALKDCHKQMWDEKKGMHSKMKDDMKNKKKKM